MPEPSRYDVNCLCSEERLQQEQRRHSDEYDNRVNSVKQKIAQSRAELLDRVRSANVGKQTANGSSITAAIASQQRYTRPNQPIRYRD